MTKVELTRLNEDDDDGEPLLYYEDSLIDLTPQKDLKWDPVWDSIKLVLNRKFCHPDFQQQQQQQSNSATHHDSDSDNNWIHMALEQVQLFWNHQKQTEEGKGITGEQSQTNPQEQQPPLSNDWLAMAMQRVQKFWKAQQNSQQKQNEQQHIKSIIQWMERHKSFADDTMLELDDPNHSSSMEMPLEQKQVVEEPAEEDILVEEEYELISTWTDRTLQVLEYALVSWLILVLAHIVLRQVCGLSVAWTTIDP